MSVEAPAISSIGSSIEAGISHSAAPAMSSIGVGGSFEGHFSPSYLGTLPEHTINPTSFNTDRVVPVPEMVFNQKLFQVVYQAQEKPSGVALPDFLGLPEYRVDPESFAAKTELTPVSAKLIWEQEDRFPLIYQAQKEPNKPETEQVVIFGTLQPEKPNILLAEAEQVPVEEEVGPSVFYEPDTEIAQKQADTKLIEGVKEQLQDESVWSPEEKIFWETLFGNAIAAEDKTETETTVQTAAETQTMAAPITRPQMEAGVQNKTETETDTEILTMAEADILQPNIAAVGQKAPEEKEQQKSPDWQIYQINSTWETAEKELEERVETAADIAAEAFQTDDPLKTMTEMAYRLDRTDIDTAFKISRGQLVYPEIASHVHDLEEEADPAKITQVGLRQAIEEIVIENKPDEQKVRVNHVATVKQEELVPQARKLAQEGAQYIVEKDGKMQAVGSPPRLFPREMDRAA